MINNLPESQSRSIELNVGLFEVNDQGTVLYCRAGNGRLSSEKSLAVVGRNFFDEIAPFENADELRRRFKLFISSGSSTESFKFTCRIENLNIPAKVMLVRISEQSYRERAKTTIVDIRKI